MREDLDSLAGLLQPLNMEPRTSYIGRFVANRQMREIFHHTYQRAQMAETVFRARWKDALVTVTKADGEEFFID